MSEAGLLEFDYFESSGAAQIPMLRLEVTGSGRSALRGERSVVREFSEGASLAALTVLLFVLSRNWTWKVAGA